MHHVQDVKFINCSFTGGYLVRIEKDNMGIENFPDNDVVFVTEDIVFENVKHSGWGVGRTHVLQSARGAVFKNVDITETGSFAALTDLSDVSFYNCQINASRNAMQRVTGKFVNCDISYTQGVVNTGTYDSTKSPSNKVNLELIGNFGERKKIAILDALKIK